MMAVSCACLECRLRLACSCEMIPILRDHIRRRRNRHVDQSNEGSRKKGSSLREFRLEVWYRAMSQMWGTVIAKLKGIEDNLARQGKYVDEFDAMSLASAETSDGSEGVSSPLYFSPTTQLKGLTKLAADISTVLHEAYIEQQGALIVIKAEIDKCRHFSEKSIKHGGDINKVRDSEESCNDLSEAGTPSGSSPTSSGKSSHTSKSGLLKKKAAQRKFRLLTQELHDSLMGILDAKLIAYEVITSSLSIYLKYIVKIAEENCVLDALQRANRFVQKQLNILLAHKFIDTAETYESLSVVRVVWAKAFFHDDQALAERNLTVNLNSSTRSSHRGMTKFKMGVGVTLLLWSFSECFNNEQIGKEIWRDPTFAIFMCAGDLLLLLWMWGLSMRVWRKAGIDFVQLLGLENTEVEGQKTPEAAVYSSASDLSIMFLVIFIAFNKAVRGVLNVHGSRAFAHVLPTLMVVFFFYRMGCPTVARAKWFRMLRDVLVAPFSPVGFRDGYIGDILTSLVRVLIPLCFSFAYLIMSAVAWMSNNIQAASSTSDLWWQDSFFYRFGLVPLITLYPLWIRLMQCLRRSVETGKRFPFMANACKYASAIAVISYGTFQPYLRDDILWVACFVFATVFQFVWDLTMDWGMLLRSSSKGASECSFLGISLRKNRLLGPSWLYITVIFANFFLRFAWALTLLPEDGFDGPKTVSTIILSHLTPLIAALEVIRRMVWGFFRLEYEQLETLGCPDLSSLLSTEGREGGSLRSFDKMEICASRSGDSTDPNEGKFSLLLGHEDRTGGEHGSEWILTVPFFSSISCLILRFATLGGASNSQMKARLVESVLFSLFLMCLILSAAAPHILK